MNPQTSHIQFSPPLADSAHYPRPRFSALPTLAGNQQGKSRVQPENVKYTLETAGARYSLAYIAAAELSPGDTVLLPCYHCPALVEPFIWAQCKIIFYPVDQCLQPDADKMESLLVNAKAAVFIRYFGFSCGIKTHVEQAKQAGCLTIEDLAHAAFIDNLYGDYGVTSLPKFYPVDHGGEIYINRERSIHALSEVVTNYLSHPAMWSLRSTGKRISRKFNRYRPNRQTNAVRSYRYFDPLRLSMPQGRRTKEEISSHSSTVIRNRRREIYLTIDHALKDSKLGRPLFTHLDDSTVPYVYPFLLNNPDSFAPIRKAGIPLFRWEELTPSQCCTSAAYRDILIQIPCHQDLNSHNLSTITNFFVHVNNDTSSDTVQENSQ